MRGQYETDGYISLHKDSKDEVGESIFNRRCFFSCDFMVKKISLTFKVIFID